MAKSISGPSFGAELFAHNVHAHYDAANIFRGQIARVGIVTRLAELGIGLGWYAIALELERSPAEFLRPCFSDLRPPGLRILDALADLQRAVETDAVAEPAAQQIADRRLEHAAHQVPESDLDAAGGGNGDAADGSRAGAAHQNLGVEFVHIQRILAQQQRLHLSEDEVFHTRTPVGFADAAETGIGFDLDQIPVPGAADDHALDVGDFDFLVKSRGQALIGGRKQRGAQKRSTGQLGHSFAPFFDEEIIPCGVGQLISL